MYYGCRLLTGVINTEFKPAWWWGGDVGGGWGERRGGRGLGLGRGGLAGEGREDWGGEGGLGRGGEDAEAGSSG